jgi:hypothetical protein
MSGNGGDGGSAFCSAAVVLFTILRVLPVTSLQACGRLARLIIVEVGMPATLIQEDTKEDVDAKE